MRVNFKIMLDKEKAFMFNQMDLGILVNFLMIKKMEVVLKFIKVTNTKECILMD